MDIFHFLIIKFTPLGVSINGSKRWLNLGVQFQPSELAKISVIMLLASFFTIKESFRKYNIFKYFAPILLMIALIYKQPNLSMTIILFAVVVCMYVCSTKNIKLIVSLVLLAVLGVGLVATNIIDLSKYIEPYQLSRITNWQNPESDIQGGGYNVFHSLIAISSGGIVGEGYGASKEKLGWLPECHTDFIFAVIAEEMGLIGTILIIGLFWTFLQRGLLISHRCSDAYGKLLSKDRYTKHTKNATTTAGYLQGIVDGGYCPDAGYVTDVLNIIHDNNLEQYNTSEYKGVSDIEDNKTSTNVTGINGILSSITSWVLMLVILILAILFLVGAFS